MRRTGSAAVLLGTMLAIGCGSRTTFGTQDGPPPPPECTAAADCPGFGDQCFPVACVAGSCQDATPIDCDDGDVCTTDLCDSTTGACTHGPSTLDLDGDGHRAPLPGKRPGEAGSCGDDCDDRNASAQPGGQEICDGVDNDCNGIIDDGAAVLGTGETVRVSELAKSHDASLAYPGGSNYLAAYTGQIPSSDSSATYTALLSASGQRIGSSTRFTQTALDAQDGRAAWTGDRFGLAWAQREGINDYDIYFNLANVDGSKRKADVRITQADGFSINHSLLWTGNEFVLIWQDEGLDRFRPDQDQIYGQRIDVNGNLSGGHVKLIDDPKSEQIAPQIAAGPTSFGIIWTQQRASESDLMFAVFDRQLNLLGTPTQLSDRSSPVYSPVIAANGSQYVIAWADNREIAPRQIIGTVRSEAGETIVAAKALTKTPGFARMPDLLPYGDRLLLLWSDTRDNGAAGAHPWTIYASTLDSSLNPLVAETRITGAGADSEAPQAAFGPRGEVGIVYNERAVGSTLEQVMFTRLVCLPGASGGGLH